MKEQSIKKRQLISKDFSFASVLQNAFQKKDQMRKKLEFMTQEFVPVTTVLENGIKKEQIKNMELSQKYYMMSSPTNSNDQSESQIFQ